MSARFRSAIDDAEAVRIFFDELLDEVAIAQRHCGENVMACPALEEQVDDGFVALARGPTDHVAVVQVAGAVNVSAGIEEQANALERPFAAAKWSGVALSPTSRALGFAPCSMSSRTASG